MADDARRRMEMQAALKQIKDIQKRQAKQRRGAWRLDVSLPKLAVQGIGAFLLGVLVGMGMFVLYWIAFT